jgi:hypothetical protein
MEMIKNGGVFWQNGIFTLVYENGAWSNMDVNSAVWELKIELCIDTKAPASMRSTFLTVRIDTQLVRINT